MRARRCRHLASVLVLGLGLASCGAKQAHPTVANADNDGTYIDAGSVTYQLEVSRELNQYGTEDAAYVKGLPAGTPALGGTSEWYGVFLWAKNQTHHTQTTSDRFEIVDTQGNTYYPVRLDPNLNPFAWTSESLPPLQTEPGPDTVAHSGPTQGGLLLFKISTNAYANRPLTLYILGAQNQRLGSISLDL